VSNRRRPRLVEYLFVRGSDADALALGLRYKCPDCASEVGPAAPGSGLMLEVRHDDSCPWLQARTRIRSRQR
jgi:hypothetical protein